MSVPSLTAGSDSAQHATTHVTVEISHSHGPPMLPFELRDHVSPNTWAARMSMLMRMASQYCQPTFERAYFLIVLILTLLVPITTYYVILSRLEKTVHDADKQVWFARLSAFGLTLGAWAAMCMPVVIWKCTGRVRIMKLARHWTRSDVCAVTSHRTAPVWNASAPGLFKGVIVLKITIPVKSNFDRNSVLPPYIAAGSDGLPPYDVNLDALSKNLEEGFKHGELPIYRD